MNSSSHNTKHWSNSPLQTVSRLLEENGLPQQSNDLTQNSDGIGSFEKVDIESGIWQRSSSSFQTAIIRHKIKAGQRQLGSILRQFDIVLSIGAVYLRRNQKAQVLALIYLLCLHFWVFFVLNSNSHISDGTKSGAVFSLETINNTSNPWWPFDAIYHFIMVSSQLISGFFLNIFFTSHF